MKKVEMIGKRFGRLVVINQAPHNPTKERVKYFCKCDCGNQSTFIGKYLRNGATKSCGCLITDILLERNKKNIKHGLSGTRTHQAYLAAKGRCRNKEDPAYDEVKFKYSSLDELIQDVGICPEGMELDRINPYYDYEPGNCRWADGVLQSSNKRMLKRNKSGAQGVRFDGKKWIAEIRCDNKSTNLGHFEDFWAAHQTYLTYYFIKNNEYPPQFRGY